MDAKKKKRLIEVFQRLLRAYKEAGLSELNSRRVKELVDDMEAENGFFNSPPDKQNRTLRFMKEIHLGRGEMFYALEEKGGVSPSFWMTFNSAIEEYLDALIGKSYTFPDK